MLGTKTKQIHSYGKRAKRTVNISQNQPLGNIFDDMEPVPRAPIASKMKKREHTAHAKPKTPSPKVVRVRRKRKSPVLAQSPTKKLTRLAHILDAEPPTRTIMSKTIYLAKDYVATPSRTPLAPFSLNTLGSPAVAGKLLRSRALEAKGTTTKLNKPFSPFVDIDIITLDDEGTTVRKERRVSRTDIQPNPNSSSLALKRSNKVSPQKSQAALFSEGMELEDNQGPVEPLRRHKRQGIRSALTIYSDDSDSEDDQLLPPTNQDSKAHNTSHTIKIPRTRVEVLVPPTTYPIRKKISTPPRPRTPPPPSPDQPIASCSPSTNYQHFPSPVARPRPLTPIRARTGVSGNRFNPPCSPSPSLTSTDLDLSLEFEELNIAALSQSNQALHQKPVIPEYLKPLLSECGQSVYGPIDFSSFIETFPFDPIVKTSVREPDKRFKKIGEASYSEVFGIGDVVLKVVPLRDEEGGDTVASTNEDEKEDGPAPTDAKDVWKEIIVTQAMGEVCDGFVKLLRAYVVRGKYPEVLLRLWDEYAITKGSESIRPDKFLVSQVYAIIMLPNGGPDLEAYKFITPSKTGWRQACSIFWQVAKSLARAEQLVSFEHRDLHVGQILVKDLPMPEALPLQARNQNAKSSTRSPRVYMDDPVHGVRTTLIDLGLSRMDAGDGNGGEMVHWTPFEDEVFMGEGDYQFDIYRMMREQNGGAWQEFRPLTNVMWLHYLAVKLLQSKRLKSPTSRPSPTNDTAAYTEKACYDCLVDIELWLRDCLAVLASKAKQTKPKGRKRAQAPLSKPAASAGPVCAGEIVAYAAKMGWIQPI